MDKKFRVTAVLPSGFIKKYHVRADVDAQDVKRKFFSIFLTILNEHGFAAQCKKVDDDDISIKLEIRCGDELVSTFDEKTGWTTKEELVSQSDKALQKKLKEVQGFTVSAAKQAVIAAQLTGALGDKKAKNRPKK